MTWVKLLVMSMLLIGLFDGLITRTAFADRHCALVLENYYAARQQVIANNGNSDAPICEQVFKQTREHFEEAIADATNCGCNPLKEKLQATLLELKAFYDKPTSADTSCSALLTAVLDARSTLEKALLQCH